MASEKRMFCQVVSARPSRKTRSRGIPRFSARAPITSAPDDWGRHGRGQDRFFVGAVLLIGTEQIAGVGAAGQTKEERKPESPHLPSSAMRWPAILWAAA